MTKILKTVLAKKENIKRATNSYIDDILIDETEASPAEVIDHLKTYGLVTKPPEPLEGGAALGLKFRSVGGDLQFQRGNELMETPHTLTRRELFSLCGKLVGHYPVAGWLRIACSYIKRQAEGSGWDDQVGENTVSKVKEVLETVKKDDPVKASWYVRGGGKGVVWSDASNLALGVVIEISGSVVEDAAWLRKKDDYNHINVAELEAALKGINLALKWGLQTIELKTDSATVSGWIRSVISEERRVRTKGAAEMIVKRRLGNLKDLISEYDLEVIVMLVPTTKNKADALTRVKKTWHITETRMRGDRDACCVGALSLKDMHDMNHLGVERSLYLARKVDPETSRQAVKGVVRSCMRCQSIDPAPVTHEKGEVSVNENWKRLAIDVTHYRHVPYLTMIDCGPGRLAIWRELRSVCAEQITNILNSVFLERGPVDEVLMDNGTVFHSEVMKRMLGRWNIHQFFRAAYRPEGNGIIERNHRTIKAIAERGNISPPEAVYCYNITPRSGQAGVLVPQQAVFKYDWRHPAVVPELGNVGSAPVKLGEEVWGKPPNARCTTRWKIGEVTKINSKNNVSVDGVPRHVLDLRRVVRCPDEIEELTNEAVGSEDEVVGEHQHQGRERRPPAWMADFYMGDDY